MLPESSSSSLERHNHSTHAGYSHGRGRVGAKPKMNVRKIDKINSLLGGLGQGSSRVQLSVSWPAQHVCVCPRRGAVVVLSDGVGWCVKIG